MNILGFFKNVAYEIGRKNEDVAKSVDDVFKAKMDCGCFAYDCCDGIVQLPQSEKNRKAGLPNKAMYLADNGDLYFGTVAQARTYRKTGVNGGTKLN